MSRITTIDHLSMPNDHVDEFFKIWNAMKDFMLRQPGAEDGVIHRTIDEDSPFQVINVAHWASADDLRNARETLMQRFQYEGEALPAMLERLNVTISQHNYVEEDRY